MSITSASIYFFEFSKKFNNFSSQKHKIFHYRYKLEASVYRLFSLHCQTENKYAIKQLAFDNSELLRFL